MNIPVIRILLLAALLAPASTFGQSATPTSIPTQHNEATVAQLQAEMASGSLTSEQLTQEYINRILALDQNGPGVNSVIELNPDRSEEHTSELQSPFLISYAVFCLKKK